MLALHLVRLIETHSDTLARSLLTRIQASPRAKGLQKIPEPELLDGIREVLLHLSEWLVTRTDPEIELRCRAAGARLAGEGVALADACWAVAITREYLCDFLQKQGFLRSSIELYGELELLTQLSRFFDHMLCYAAEGYEQSVSPESRRRTYKKWPEPNIAALVP